LFSLVLTSLYRSFENGIIKTHKGDVLEAKSESVEIASSYSFVMVYDSEQAVFTTFTNGKLSNKINCNFNLVSSCLDILLGGYDGLFKNLCIWNISLSIDEIDLFLRNGIDYIISDWISDFRFQNSFYNLQDSTVMSKLENCFEGNGGGSNLNIYSIIIQCKIEHIKEPLPFISLCSSLGTKTLYFDPSGAIINSHGSYVSLGVIAFNAPLKIVIISDLSQRSWKIYANCILIYEEKAFLSDDEAQPNISLNVDGPLSICSEVLVLSSDSLKVSSAQLRNFAIDDEELQAFERFGLLGPFRQVSSILTSIYRMGIPESWSVHAFSNLYTCKDSITVVGCINRWRVLDWIFCNVEKLHELDEEFRLDGDAAILSLMGYSKEASICALKSSPERSLQIAINYLLDSKEKLLVNAESIDDRLEHENSSVSVGLNELAKVSNLMIATNSTYSVQNSLESNEWNKFSLRKLHNFSEETDESFYPSMISLHETLSTLWSRKCLIFYLKLIPKADLFEPAFLRKFIRLLCQDKCYEDFQSLKEYFVNIIVSGSPFAEILLFELVNECIYHMIGSVMLVRKRKMGDPDVTRPSSDLALWLLDIYLHIEEDLKLLKGRLFIPQIINLIFEMILIASSSDQVSYLKILNRLIKSRKDLFQSDVGLLNKLMRLNQYMLLSYKKNFPSNMVNSVDTKHILVSCKIIFYNSVFDLCLAYFQILVETMASCHINGLKIGRYEAGSWFAEYLLILKYFELLELQSNDASLFNEIYSAVDLTSIEHLKQDNEIFKSVRFVIYCYDSNTYQVNFSLEKLDLNRSLVILINESFAKNNLDPLASSFDMFSLCYDDLLVYKDLGKESMENLQIRFVFLQFLNRIAMKVLPLVNFSYADADSKVAYLFRKYRFVLFQSLKEKFWTIALELSSNSSSGCGEVRIDRFRASNLRESGKIDHRAKKTVFGQLYNQIGNKEVSSFRIRKNERAWKTIFLGEYSDDFGGPYRACLDDIASELQSSVLQLFIPCPNRIFLYICF
jgi:hypothetical protein